MDESDLSLNEARLWLRQRWYDEGWFEDTTLAEAIERGCAEHPGTELCFAGTSRVIDVSLSTLVARGRRAATELHKRGFGPGDVLAVQVPNWVEGAVAYVAAILLGAVVVPIIHIYGPAEVGFILRQSRAKLLIIPDRWRSLDYVARLDDVRAVPDLESVVVIGEQVPKHALAWTELDPGDLPTSRGVAPIGATFERRSPDDVAFQIYTSGTTGEPKGVRHSHNSLLAEVRSTAQTLGGRLGGPSLGAFPAGHIAGVSSLLRSFVLGSSSVLLDIWDPDLAASLVEARRIVSTAGTPYFLTSLFESGDRNGNDLSSLERFMVGAANVPPSVVELAEARGIASYRAYGSTEHPTISSGGPTDPPDRRAGTDGRLTPGNEIRIVDDAGEDVADGLPGEILCRGPEQFIGYSDPKFDDESFLAGGWFRTGDIGVVEDGYLTIVDRKKDIIIRGGENISSKEVEDLLLLHPAVADVAVVAAPDQRLGETVCAFVILRTDASLDMDDVRDHFRRAGVAIQKTPQKLVSVRELPRGHGGKVQKVELRRRLADG